MSFYLFVYGTLKRDEPEHHYLEYETNGTSKFVSTAQTVKRYPLIIDTQYNIPFLIHREGMGHRILGEIYEVDERMMKTIDELKSHPNLYCRLQDSVRIFVEDEEDVKNIPVMKCWMYFITDLKRDVGPVMLRSYHSDGYHGRPFLLRGSCFKAVNGFDVWRMNLEDESGRSAE
ncbi:putative gamma-glutamylcyclotransferase CG2811 [Schistocerca americana]|uniref:putative gamma-glutamylcyclotransferase CG2811 n=1 Tax=Schistocerca americana TaxID=7009 RepID=UPI001F4FEF18|nr:putative gamma-glutamylcyclotransferase CG2811 [Schistocerca americana]XP_047104895.1 putative gamma-glutamylcyclotransferase CG2811 [Schistocerca piceifrons]